MADWLQVQRDVASSLRQASDDDRATRWIVGDSRHAQQRLAIYRANIEASAAKALAAAYPVCRQVVGEEFWGGLARAYLRSQPSTSGDLTEHGAQLPTFLGAFPHAAHLPYLPDLARLEWAAHLAYGAVDALPLDACAFHTVPADRQADIRLTFVPGCASVRSAHPIVRIWTIHQADFGGAFEVDWSTRETAWVARRGFRVTVESMSAGEAAFLGGMLAGATLGDAIPPALAAEPGFDLGAVLARLLRSQSVAGIELRGHENRCVEPSIHGPPPLAT